MENQLHFSPGYQLILNFFPQQDNQNPSVDTKTLQETIDFISKLDIKAFIEKPSSGFNEAYKSSMSLMEKGFENKKNSMLSYIYWGNFRLNIIDIIFNGTPAGWFGSHGTGTKSRANEFDGYLNDIKKILPDAKPKELEPVNLPNELNFSDVFGQKAHALFNILGSMVQLKEEIISFFPEVYTKKNFLLIHPQLTSKQTFFSKQEHLHLSLIKKFREQFPSELNNQRASLVNQFNELKKEYEEPLNELKKEIEDLSATITDCKKHKIEISPVIAEKFAATTLEKKCIEKLILQIEKRKDELLALTDKLEPYQSSSEETSKKGEKIFSYAHLKTNINDVANLQSSVVHLKEETLIFKNTLESLSFDEMNNPNVFNRLKALQNHYEKIQKNLEEAIDNQECKILQGLSGSMKKINQKIRDMEKFEETYANMQHILNVKLKEIHEKFETTDTNSSSWVWSFWS